MPEPKQQASTHHWIGHGTKHSRTHGLDWIGHGLHLCSRIHLPQDQGLRDCSRHRFATQCNKTCTCSIGLGHLLVQLLPVLKFAA